MKVILLIFVLLFSSLTLPAQALLIPVKDPVSGLFGYKKASSKSWIIKPAFESAECLVNGTAIVKKEGYGLINATGKFILSPEYDLLYGDSLLTFKKSDTLGIANRDGKILLSGNFNHVITDEESGTAILIQDSLYGYWDTSGAYISPFSIYELMFSKGMAYYETDHTKGFINKEGAKIIEIEEGNIIELEGKGFVVRNGRDRYVDPQGKKLTDFEKIIQVTDSLVLFYQNQKYGMINRFNGMNKGEFELLHPFTKNRLAVGVKNGKYGIVNESGDDVLPFSYEFIEDLGRGNSYLEYYKRGKEYISMRQNNLWGVINDKGEVIIEPRYESAKTEEELLWYTEKDSLKFINIHSGKPVKASEVLHFNLDRAIACMGEENTGCGLINRDGRFFIPSVGERIQDLYNGYYIISESKGSGVMDSVGKKIISPLMKEIKTLGEIQPSKTGTHFISDNFLYLFGKSGRVGIANARGKILSDTLWQNLSVFDEDGKCFFAKNKKGSWDLVSASGKKYPVGLDTPSIFSGGYAVVKKKGKYGLIDSRGKKSIPIKYQNIVHQRNGLNFYQENNLWGLLSARGKILTKPLYTIVTEFKGSIALVNYKAQPGHLDRDGSWGFLDKNGKFFPGFKKLYEIKATRQVESDSIKIIPFSITYLKGLDELSFELLADSSDGYSLRKEVNKLILESLSSKLNMMSTVSVPLLVKDKKTVQSPSYRGMGIEIKDITRETVCLEFYKERFINMEDEIEDSVKVYWFKDDSLTRVYLHDLFLQGSWIPYLNEIIASKLRQQNYRIIPSHGSLVFFDPANFTIGASGLTLTLNETALGLSYDFSEQEILIEYGELEEIIKKNGPLREFFQ